MAQLTSRFTPSLLDEKTLNRLFVHRHDLVEDARGRIERAATTDERAHRLFIGPRGAGKTHLISLIFHAARKLQDADERLQVAWLSEDPWGIDSYDDLLTEILERIGLPDSESPQADLLDAVATGGPIVVLLENLDQILDALGADGRRRLRALMENHRPLLLIATSTRLTAELKDQSEPFYGFFDTTQLKPFDVDEATAMLQAIARVQDDEGLAYRLDQPSARARLAAVRHLAGGQPRVWALLGTGLTADALDDLVDVLMHKFDDLTPYYQEQLAKLSGNERKVVLRLASSGRAMTVRELAELTKIDQKSLARTATDLRRKGWIHPRTGLLMQHVDKRLTYYELSEPLVRLAFQLKASRGEPIKLILDFLSMWFELEEISRAKPHSPLAMNYATAATELIEAPQARISHRLANRVQAMPRFQIVLRNPSALRTGSNDAKQRTLLAALDSAVLAFTQGDPHPLLMMPSGLSQLMESRLQASTPTRIRIELALLATEDADPASWIPMVDSIVSNADSADRPLALTLAALVHLREDRSGEAYLQAALDVLADSDDQEVAEEVVGIADRLLQLGHAYAAERLAGAVLASASLHTEMDLIQILAETDLRRGDFDRPIGRWRSFVKRNEQEGHLVSGFTAKNGLALALRDAGRTDEALDLLLDTIRLCEEALEPDNQTTLSCRNSLALIYQDTGDMTNAIEILEQGLAAMERSAPDGIETLTCRNNLGIALREVGRSEDAVALLQDTVLRRERRLGANHPLTLLSRSNLALALFDISHADDVAAMFASVLADSELVLGRDHPDTASRRDNLVIAYLQTGRLQEAARLSVQNAAIRAHVLGDTHRDTIASLQLRDELQDLASPDLPHND